MREGRERVDLYKKWEAKKPRIQGIGDDLADCWGNNPFNRRLDKISVLEALETSSTMRMNIFHKTNFKVSVLHSPGPLKHLPNFLYFISN
jgi:hypothetical protein